LLNAISTLLLLDVRTVFPINTIILGPAQPSPAQREDDTNGSRKTAFPEDEKDARGEKRNMV
jgi:hypothetical protein